MSEVVVDASVALCWFAREKESPSANRLISSRAELIAPSLLLAEFGNALWKKTRRGEMTIDVANAAVKEIRRFIPQFVDLSEIAAEAFELAREINHSVYDCCYLALALRRGATVVTLDRQFIAGVAKSGRARSVLHPAEWSANG